MVSLPFVLSDAVAYPGILFGGGSTNSVEDRGQIEQGSADSLNQLTSDHCSM